MREFRLNLALLLASTIALEASATAGVISVNFTESHANQQLATSTIAGVWPRANWNNTMGASGFKGILFDADDASTTASLTWGSAVVWGDPEANIDATAGVGDAQVARGYIDDGQTSPGIGAHFTVTGVPYTNYTVVLLMSTDVQGGTYTPGTINGGIYTSVGEKRQYSTSPQQWDINTTIIAENLTNSTLTVSMAPRAYSSRGSIGGFQIVAHTEGDHPPFPSQHDPAPPVWQEDPIAAGSGTVDTSYFDTLAGKATDPNRDPITYSKVAGPLWLTVAADGTLSGTPLASGLGTNTFTVAATDIDGTTAATLTILVKELQLSASNAISVNFTEGYAHEQLAANTHAGLDYHAYTNWNNMIGNTGSRAGLLDSIGNNSGATINWASHVTWHDPFALTAAVAGVGDAQLAMGYLDDGRADLGQAPASWSVSGIPFTQYHVVLYLSTDVAGGAYHPFWVNGTNHSVTASPKSRYRNSNWDGSNTIVATNLTGNLAVKGYNRAGIFNPIRGSVGGFQIIAATNYPLTVASAHGSPLPAHGAHGVDPILPITCSVDSPVLDGGKQYVCTGWTGTGNIPASGTNNHTAEVRIEMASSITWNWETNQWLDVTVVGNGGLNVADGWCFAGSIVDLVASPDTGWLFMGWSGDLASDHTTASTNVLMDSAKAVTATFSDDADGDGLTNTQEGSLGTDPRDSDSDEDRMPDGWEQSFGLQPTVDDASGNKDGDAHSNLQEFITGMSPNDPESIFTASTAKVEIGNQSYPGVTWEAFTNRTYNVLWAASLTNSFLPLEAERINYPQNSYTDTVHGVESQGFYKVDVQLK